METKMKFNIKRSVEPNNTFRVDSVIGTYDLQSKKIDEEFEGEIVIPEKWNVGVIVGKSGTGKSTIVKELFPDAYVYDMEYKSASILDDMPKNVSMKDIAKAFMSVGFASIPSWLKPYSVLSNGEKMRVDLARSILEGKETVLFDEFTSVVDRHIAKVGSLAVSREVRRKNIKFIAVSCHSDIIEYLEPDWVFSTDEMQNLTLKKKDQNSMSRYSIHQTKVSGTFLKSITI